MQKIAQGAIGAVIDIPIGTDADGVAWSLGAATLTILAVPPSGTQQTWTAEVVTLADGGQGFRYLTVTDDINEAGVWWLRPRIQQGADGTYVDGRDFFAAEPVPLEVRP